MCITLASSVVGALAEVPMKAKGKEVATNSWGESWLGIGRGKALCGSNRVLPKRFVDVLTPRT